MKTRRAAGGGLNTTRMKTHGMNRDETNHLGQGPPRELRGNKRPWKKKYGKDKTKNALYYFLPNALTFSGAAVPNQSSAKAGASLKSVQS